MGRGIRKKVPRSAHAKWKRSSQRADPIQVIEESNRGRLKELIPIRYGRMSASSFAFLRGSAAIMAKDLATTPNTGIRVQACGDAHLSNFGLFASPERRVLFDVNDFDETLPAPWEWDLKRLAASIWVAGRNNGHSEADNARSATEAVQHYRLQMLAETDSGFLQAWYVQLEAENILTQLKKRLRRRAEKLLGKTRQRTSLSALPKYAVAKGSDFRIVDDPPLVVHAGPIEKDLEHVVHMVAKHYLSTLTEERQALFLRYRPVDAARKVVGVGSVGTLCLMVLLLGKDPNDPLFLQIKEARPSVLEPYAGASAFPNAGQRIVVGQRTMQASSDIFLGWFRHDNRDFYVRQLRDMKGSVDVQDLDAPTLLEYARLCGLVLAQSHAREGQADLLAGYLGSGDACDKAIVDFARAYADQNEEDYDAFKQAIRKGKLAAEKA